MGPQSIFLSPFFFRVEVTHKIMKGFSVVLLAGEREREKRVLKYAQRTAKKNIENFDCLDFACKPLHYIAFNYSL